MSAKNAYCIVVLGPFLRMIYNMMQNYQPLYVQVYGTIDVFVLGTIYESDFLQD